MKKTFLFDCYFDQADELKGNHRPAGGLRGWKYPPYEGGTRVPFIARWPGRVQTGVDDRMICLTGLLATCAALTGQRLPTGAGVRTELVEQGISHSLALRAGDWKFIPRSPQQAVSGMGSGANPAETTNVIARHPDQAAALRARLEPIKRAP
jgi:arylsulfatase A-like enzyme